MDTTSPNTLPNMEPENKKGASIGIIIVLLIIVAGGVYYFMKKETSNMQPLPVNTTQVENNNGDAMSDNLNDISTDLNATNFDTLDTNVQ